jgi:hypothetical protein
MDKIDSSDELNELGLEAGKCTFVSDHLEENIE